MSRFPPINQSSVRPRHKIATLHTWSHPEYFDAFVVADSDPVGLVGGPLYIVDFPFGSVSKDGVLDSTWHLLDVPDQRLVVVR